MKAQTALLMVAFIVSGLTWLRTGRDPLYWLARAVIALRAALILAGRISIEACGEFAARFPSAVERSKWEVSA